MRRIYCWFALTLPLDVTALIRTRETLADANQFFFSGGGLGDVEVSSLVEESFEWTSNLGAPAALVAGAVIATMYENIRSGDLELLESDTTGTRMMKKLTRFLLLSAFALEIMCIFATTVTGTVLLSRSLDVMDNVQPISKGSTPLSFLHGNFEFEYLTARITMLQGLINWLLAIGLNHLLPTPDAPVEMVYLNKFIAWSLFSCIALMSSFYNKHMTFYANYFEMLCRWLTVTWDRFFWKFPPRPLALIFIPSLSYSAYLGYKTFAHDEVHTFIQKRKRARSDASHHSD